jgi:hypothetical protein
MAGLWLPPRSAPPCAAAMTKTAGSDNAIFRLIVEKDTMEPVCRPMAQRWQMPSVFALFLSRSLEAGASDRVGTVRLGQPKTLIARHKSFWLTSLALLACASGRLFFLLGPSSFR